jgi:xanthine dehydrogenase accessory factor
MRDVLRQLITALEEDRELIVCQVVETRGSTPQKAGAMMVVDPGGGQAGTLGGGCIENEVKVKAIQQLGGSAGAAFSFVLDHDYAWADGLICGGKMTIVTQPTRGPDALAYYRAVLAQSEAGTGFTEAIVVDGGQCDGRAVGSRFLFDSEGELRARFPGGAGMDGLDLKLTAAADRPRPKLQRGIALLANWPRVRLIVVGAGHVGQAVAKLAAQTDFDVWVVDDRHQYANRERFPTAQQILVGPLDDLLRALEITPATYALIVTRGHGHDQEALYHLAGTPCSYLGLIGSRRKIRMIFDNLLQAGISQSALDRVSAPVGLDIGSESVNEIAVSIVAELIARRNLGSVAPAGRSHEGSRKGATSGVPAGDRVAGAP